MAADAYYAQKIASGLMEPVEAYLSPCEIEATVNGKYRGDGRRLDCYVTDERRPFTTIMPKHPWHDRPETQPRNWLK